MRPGIDAAAQAAHLLEAVASKIGSSIETLLALVIVNDKRLVARPAREDFLHGLLRHEDRTGDGDGFVFLARANVEEAQRWVLLHFDRRHEKFFVLLMAGLDVG